MLSFDWGGKEERGKGGRWRRKEVEEKGGWGGSEGRSVEEVEGRRWGWGVFVRWCVGKDGDGVWVWGGKDVWREVSVPHHHRFPIPSQHCDREEFAPGLKATDHPTSSFLLSHSFISFFLSPLDLHLPSSLPSVFP